MILERSLTYCLFCYVNMTGRRLCSSKSFWLFTPPRAMRASIDGIQLASSISDQEIKHRVEFIDVAKALAIIAVIAGHTAIRFLG